MNKIRWSRYAAVTAILVACTAYAGDWDDRHWGGRNASAEFAKLVRRETARFLDVNVAVAEGYGVLLGCVSGRESGAMGIHYLNESLVGDGALDPARPEVLIYEPRSRGRMRLVGVEYLTFADAWHAGNEGPPVLEGQVFHYTGAPNRYAAPAHYELHVWAWRSNPNGTFADWNPRVSCDEYDPS